MILSTKTILDELVEGVGEDLALMLINLVNCKKQPAELQKLFRASLLRRRTDSMPPF